VRAVRVVYHFVDHGLDAGVADHKVVLDVGQEVGHAPEGVRLHSQHILVGQCVELVHVDCVDIAT
jgi:hypothetical protein